MINKDETLEHRLKILFFHNTLPEYRIDWFKEMSNIADVDFVFTNEGLNKKDYGFDIDYKRISGLNCIFLPKGNKGKKQIKDILNKVSSYDFVELPPLDSYADVYYGKIIINACKKNNINVGYFWEKWEAPKDKQPMIRKIKNYILRVVPKMIYKDANIIYAVGEKSKQYFISNGIDNNKIVIIPDVSETPKCEYQNIREKYGIDKNKKIVMYLGRMMPQKGVQYLIKAFAKLDKRILDELHMLIAGDGDDTIKCKELADELKIENITFAGAVEPLFRGNYFSQCDIFVYPITYFKGWVDVWGLTLNEAIQHRKIVIATDAVGSAYELIKEGNNGFRISPENVEELKISIEKVIEEGFAEKAEITDADLMIKFNFKNMAYKYIEAIKNVREIM